MLYFKMIKQRAYIVNPFLLQYFLLILLWIIKEFIFYINKFIVDFLFF